MRHGSLLPLRPRDLIRRNNRLGHWYLEYIWCLEPLTIQYRITFLVFNDSIRKATNPYDIPGVEIEQKNVNLSPTSLLSTPYYSPS